jgi:hypothetical protein
MEKGKKGIPFSRQLVMEDGRPRLYISVPGEEGQPTGKPGPSRQASWHAKSEHLGESKREPAMFFGHHLGKLLVPEEEAKDDFVTLDRQLASTRDIVRDKLERTQASRRMERGDVVEDEEERQLRFVEERNAAQEELFRDLVRHHEKFETGMDEERLWSLFDLMKKEARHEKACSLGGDLKEVVECSLLAFLRQKAVESAWQALEECLVRFEIPFPSSTSMESPDDPVRNEKVKEEFKASKREDFLKMPADLMANLILGNVPIWVYSYPGRNTYLWNLTVLQGVAAGLAADRLMTYLTAWEEHSEEILDKIREKFTDRIQQVRRQGEAAVEIHEVLSVSREVQLISTEQIPEEIWKVLSSIVIPR